MKDFKTLLKWEAVRAKMKPKGEIPHNVELFL